MFLCCTTLKSCISLAYFWYHQSMKNGSSLHTLMLPPPVGTILLYAADGLSVRNGNLNAAGRPRTPKRSIWVPMFRNLIDTDEGLGTLYSLAEDGMRAWACSPDQVNSLNDAFMDITFRALSIAALEHLVATAHEPVVMQEPSKKSAPQPEGAKPISQSVATSVAPSRSAPCRPFPRQTPHRFTP
jgi:hypothetical protein